MRFLAYAALSLSALVLAGCGSDVDVELVWGGPPEPGAGGVVSVDGFAAALREQRCQPGRGHQDFAADECV